MQAPFAESIRGVQLHIEITEPDESGRLVARRTVGSGAPNHEGLEEAFVLTREDAGQFIDWLTAWLAGDSTYRWLRLGREADIAARTRLSLRRRFEVAR
jgi:hypothetical protein